MLFAFQIVNAQITLNVIRCVPTLDRVILSGEYTSTALVTLIGVTLYAMDGGVCFYMAATWQDSTGSINKILWYNSSITGFTNWYSKKS
jgi:hypothetical protein